MSWAALNNRDIDKMANGTRKSRIPYLFFGFFGVVFFANALLIWFALNSWTGLKSDQPYVRGLDYNSTLDAVEAQKALGWSMELADRVEEGTLILTVALLDRENAPISGAEVSVDMLRPTHEGVDQNGKAVEIAPGRYEYRVIQPLPGQWDIRQIALYGDKSYVQVERIFIDPDLLGSRQSSGVAE